MNGSNAFETVAPKKTFMKNKATITSLMVSFAIAIRAMAAMGELSEPDLALPSDTPAAVRAKVAAVLDQPDCKYLGGTWFNDRSFLKYGGETLALNRFLETLSQCPGFTLSIRFYKFAEDEKLDWSVEHDSRLLGNKVIVRVNLNSTRIKLEDLVVPDTKDPGLPKKK